MSNDSVDRRLRDALRDAKDQTIEAANNGKEATVPPDSAEARAHPKDVDTAS